MNHKIKVDKYNASVYNTHTLESVIIELLEAAPLQRLKHIQQHGPNVWAWDYANITRFEHTLGVLLLLKSLNVNLETQIAGVLHDVSHTVFSHAVDFLFGKHLTADYADNVLEEYIITSEIPQILERHGYSYTQFTNPYDYPLLKNKLPDVCADRLDYLCRDMYKYGLMRFDEIRFLLDSLVVFSQEIVFSNEDAAYLCSKKFIEANEKVFGSAETIFFHTVIAEALNIALSKKIIQKQDLFETDIFVRNKLIESKDEEVLAKMDLISPSTRLIENPDDYEYHLRVKVRIPDPKILVNNRTIRLSDLRPSFAKEMKKAVDKHKEGYYVHIQKT